jgi:O-antigen/teichoic acid export membrane protein
MTLAPFSSRSRRIRWGLLDQAVSSLTNFTITLLVARVAGPLEFGVFSLAMTLYLFLLWVSRCLTTEPFVVRLTSGGPEEQRVAAIDASGTAVAIGAFTGLFVLVIGFIAEPFPHSVLGGMALAMPALFCQDAFRYVLIVAGRARAAAANDLIWLTVQTSLGTALVLSGHASAPALVAAFGFGAALAAIVGRHQTRVVPSPRSSFRWLRRHSDLGLPFLFEHLAITGAVQVAMVAIAAQAGVVIVGQLRAAMVLLGPLTVVFVGLTVVAMPEAVRLKEKSLLSLSRLVAALALAMPLMTGVWAVAVTMIPDRLGYEFLRANWSSGRELLVPVAALVAGNSCASAAVVGLRALGAARQSLRARIIGTPVMLVTGVIGASMAGARGAAVGLAAATWVDALLAWGAFVHMVRRERLGSMI